jgi:phosphate starvation-inducible PhoH-like protein
VPNSSTNKDTKLEFAITEVNPLALFGTEDQLLKTIEAEHPTVSVLVRGNQVSITGAEAECFAAKKLIDEAIKLVQAGLNVAPADISRSAQMIQQSQSPAQMLSQSILSNRGKSIRPKTANQKNYVDAIDQNTIVFGIGPAGTGKTYLAMAKAVQALQRKEVSRIILTRPAVEAGERLGFLPGTLTDKIDPYLRPLFDALHEMLDPDSVPKLMATGTIEVAPLAYMRGRTLNDSFIILDEAQNTTPEQMKMFLTRLGFNSKMVVTGDVTQIDLPMGNSGLKVANTILTNVDDLAFCQLDSSDVVRHSLVGRIVDAYAKFEAKKLKAK